MKQRLRRTPASADDAHGLVWLSLPRGRKLSRMCKASGLQRLRSWQPSQGIEGALPKGRAGFALLAVLWVLVGVATLGIAVSLSGRNAVAAANNRINLTKASWRAEDCIQQGLDIIAATLAEESIEGSPSSAASWSTIDRKVASAPLLSASGCELEARAAGATLDVNTVGEQMLRRLLHLHGVRSHQVDSLVAALLDWRDADSTSRPHGAELPEYQAMQRHLPRNAALTDVRELRRVRGWAELSGLDTVFGVETDRICLNHAALPVLGSLPGFTEELVARIAEYRARSLLIEDLLAISSELAAAGKDSLLRHYPELLALTTTEPDAWILIGRAEAGTPSVGVVMEVRLVRAGSRAAIVRRRSWVL